LEDLFNYGIDMTSKKMIVSSLMTLLLVSCANEQYRVGPVIGIKLDDVKKALTNNTPKFRSCFPSEEFQGSALFKFTVNEKGQVSKSEIESHDPQAETAKGCMKNILDGIKFPAPVNATSYDVNQPINFNQQRM